MSTVVLTIKSDDADHRADDAEEEHAGMQLVTDEDRDAED